MVQGWIERCDHLGSGRRGVPPGLWRRMFIGVEHVSAKRKGRDRVVWWWPVAVLLASGVGVGGWKGNLQL